MRRKSLSGAISAVVAGCLVAGALATAGPASAASRKWTVHNRASCDHLVLESVTAWKDNPMEFEGRAHDGSWLLPDGNDHFELKYGANYQAVLKYSIGRSGGTVEFWIKNALDFADSRCRFITGSHTDNWAVEDHYDPPRGNIRLICLAMPFSRSVYLTDNISIPPPPN